MAVLAAPVAADYGNPSQQGPLHPMTFPVVGPVSYTDTFGAPREGGRVHMGQDLMGRKMQELVAAADGRITAVKQGGALSGNMVILQGADGWRYMYIHLNDDTPGTDDDARTAMPVSLVLVVPAGLAQRPSGA